MNQPDGMLTMSQLQKHIEDNTIDTVLAVFPDLYGRLLGKRVDAEFFIESVAKQGMGACNYLLTVDMEMEVIPGYTYASWEKGYGDLEMLPDLATLRVASWLDRTAMVMCDVVDPQSKELVTVAPRSLLQAQLEKAKTHGFTVNAASELEYFIFKQSYRKAAKKQYHNLQPVGWYIEDYHALQGSREEFFNGAARRHLKASGIPVETSKGEWGLGQHELNIRYANALTMADRHMVFKQCLKEIADGLEVSITFMAKFAEDGAGSSCHVHFSLYQDSKNVFLHQPDLFQWFLGGWIKHVPELMVFYAPTVNSYKRFQSGSWAPTGLAWSHDNRTAGFRIVGAGTEAMRIECRLPGADCNPYLVYAAILASGLAGIEQKIAPPPEFTGDAYADENLPRVPANLGEAAAAFAQSAFAKATFGETVVTHYAHFFQTEWQQYQAAVTDWERKRYFERI